MPQVNVKAVGAGLAAVIGAAGIAAANLPAFEGWELVGYPDPAIGAKLATACAGVTKGIELNKRYSDDECRGRTAQALIEHGLAISKCLPEQLPAYTRAAYTSLAYNIGDNAFCRSTLAKKANEGDLWGSCAEISRWVNAGGKPMPGLVKRRQYERALCEAGLQGH